MKKEKCVMCGKIEADISLKNCICGESKIKCCGNCMVLLDDELYHLKRDNPEKMKKECCKEDFDN